MFRSDGQHRNAVFFYLPDRLIMIWLIAFLTKNAAAIAIIGATAGAIQATEGAIINAVVLEREVTK
jgi:hypothetical protein